MIRATDMGGSSARRSDEPRSGGSHSGDLRSGRSHDGDLRSGRSHDGDLHSSQSHDGAPRSGGSQSGEPPWPDSGGASEPEPRIEDASFVRYGDDAHSESNGTVSEYVVSASEAMRRVLRLVDRIAPTESPVIILGESGTGKEKVARVLHYQSRRSRGPFVAVNAAAIPETLIESELFGHVRGAFTDAHREKKGLFLQADGGTLFLDEIGEMSAASQVKLLRVLEDRQVRPVGSEDTYRVDVRVVAATNRDLRAEMERGHFREDLFYRLNVFSINIPPLRDRKDDIPFLARYFLEREARAADRPVPQISDQAWSFMLNYDWPGNVRELENAVERAFAISDSNVIAPHDLPPEVTERGLPRLREGYAEGYSDDLTLEEVEARHIQRVLSKHRGNLMRTAESLEISRTTLWRKIKKYGLRVPK